MNCSECNRELQPGDELKWECNSCHQFCRANLQMLEQIQTQRENGYTAAMVNCPFCGTVLDDGNESIHWDCLACGHRMTGTIKNYVRPELFAEEEDSADQSEFAWFDSNGEEMDAPPEVEEPPKKKGFFANEEEKNEFLAETKSQALGEEIPDSIFEDAFPIRKPKKTAAEQGGTAASVSGTAASAGSQPATSVSGAASASAGSQSATSVSGAASATGSPSNAGVQKSAVPTSAATSASPFVEPPTEPSRTVGGQPAAPVSGTSASMGSSQSATPATESASNAAFQSAVPSSGSSSSAISRSAASSSGSLSGTASRSTATSPGSPSGTASRSAATSSGSPSSTTPRSTEPPSGMSSASEVSHYEPPKKAPKQILPKILTGVLAVVIVATIAVGVYFTVNFLMAPTRQFRTAVKEADYTKASDIYNNKIKGDNDEEQIAKIAVEHFLHERYDAFQNGSGDEAAYQQILEFAQNEMGMDTSDYEPGSEPVEMAEATEEPTETPAAETTEEPTETAEVSAAPEETTEAEATPEPTAEVTPEPTPEATVEPAPEPAVEEPAEGGQLAGADGDVEAALQKANKYVQKRKFEKAYNYLAKYKDTDTTGQIKKEMSSIKKQWKSDNIKIFKALCGKLTIVYYASEKRYHIVPRGYYTNYNQIARSNNVGGIAYMDQQKKTVSITNIGKDNALSGFGKTNRANLKQFKKMIEKYPYLAKEIK